MVRRHIDGAGPPSHHQWRRSNSCAWPHDIGVIQHGADMMVSSRSRGSRATNRNPRCGVAGGPAYLEGLCLAGPAFLAAHFGGAALSGFDLLSVRALLDTSIGMLHGELSPR
jgi:hypothetical protein